MTRRTRAPSPPRPPFPLSGLTVGAVGDTAKGLPDTAIALGTPLTVLFVIPREATETPREAAIGAAALTGTELSLFENALAALDDEDDDDDDGVEISTSNALS
jgi:hypothetical protein